MLVSLLVIIYVTFIALGLPDSTLGSSFPAIATNLNVSPDMAGYLSPIVSAGTILSSLFSAKLIARFKTPYVTSFSILLTALAMLGFSFVQEDFVWAFYPIAFVMGLGAGGVDAAINNYVALHYKAIHMNWLHCSWGVGASVSPLIIGSFIDSDNNSQGWEKGILVVSILLFAVVLLLFLSLPLWNKAKKREKKADEGEKTDEGFSYRWLFSNPVFYLAMVGFFSYCALETTTGLWLSTYLHQEKKLDTALSATLASTFYLGITCGRFLCGLLSLKLREKDMIRVGEGVLLLGAVLTLLPFDSAFAIAGFVLTGIGCAPIYPAIIRSTPYRFSKKASQKAMGLEMAIAYVGNLSVPPLFALIARWLGNDYSLLPFFILALLLLMIGSHEWINFRLRRRDSSLSEEERRQYDV